VRHHPVGLPQVLAYRFVDRFAASSGPQHDVDATATTERDAEEALQAAGDFAVRQAALLVEFNDRGLGIGSPVGRGGAGAVARLQGMASLTPTVALTALAEVAVELPVNGLARDLDLELMGDVGLVERASAVGADLGQRCLVDLVDLFGAGRLPVG